MTYLALNNEIKDELEQVKKFMAMVMLAEQVVDLTSEQSDICNNIQKLSYDENGGKAVYDLYFVQEDHIIKEANQAFLEHFGIGLKELDELADEFDYGRVEG